MPRTRFRPRHATIVAYLALFTALGGSAGAAGGVLDKRPSQVGKGVTPSKALKDGAAVNVAARTPAALTAPAAAGPAGLKGDAGPAGLKGDPGPKGDKGDTGLT